MAEESADALFVGTLDRLTAEHPHTDDPRFAFMSNQWNNCELRFTQFCRCTRELGEDDPRCKYQYYRAQTVCHEFLLEDWMEHRHRGTCDLDIMPDRQGWRLPSDPREWKEKHRVMVAVRLFDEYDRDDDSLIDLIDLTSLFKNLALELKLFFEVPEDMEPSVDGITAKGTEIMMRYERTGGPLKLTFIHFLPLFNEFMDSLIADI
ncbi:hypothetical protein FOL47_001147 [Perkinsus chesapeaki]|uniref:EF-hand domain-containing protein n=1 Tax=Perkinsus chesapeaki TaxID=330153 RepID=A0A7J6MJR8_PERCH|nr:hypothetical protein FOL47_001147 [Perkinsus chesapeaki]